MWRTCATCVILLFAGINAWGTQQTHFLSKFMPEGYEDLYMGMGLKQLLEKRPDAMEFSLNPSPTPLAVDPTKPDHLLVEHLAKNRFFSSAVYNIQGGKLYALVLVGQYGIPAIEANRDSFLSACLQRWGTDYERLIVELQPEKEAYLAPLLLWHKESLQIAATYTPPILHNTPPQGIFQITVFQQGQSKLNQYFKQVKVSRATSDKLFERVLTIQHRQPPKGKGLR